MCNPTKRLVRRVSATSHGDLWVSSRGHFSTIARARQPGALVVSPAVIQLKKSSARRLCRLIDEQGAALLPAPSPRGTMLPGGSANNGRGGEWIRTQRIPVMREPDQPVIPGVRAQKRGDFLFPRQQSSRIPGRVTYSARYFPSFSLYCLVHRFDIVNRLTQ